MLERAFRLIVCAAVGALIATATPVSDIVDDVSQVSYQHFLDEELYTGTGANRGLGGTQHDLARGNIQAEFVSFGLTTTLESFQYLSTTYYNVVGVQLGLMHPQDIWIVGAHYDSVNNPGADDNASGVAGVLEAARVLSNYGFEDTLVFVAFDREEQGLRGSYAYVSAHSSDNVLGMISLDMIAYGSTAAWVAYGANNSMTGALAADVSLYGGLTATMHGGIAGSDHYPFEVHGWQAALLIEPNPSQNPNYHHLSDSIDTPNYINYAYATSMTRAAVGFLADSADPIPEPGTLACVLAGLAALVILRARRPGARA